MTGVFTIFVRPLALTAVFAVIFFMPEPHPQFFAPAAAQIGPRWILRTPDDPTHVAPLLVESVINGGLTALADPRRGRAEQREVFGAMFRRFFATDEIGRSLLEQHWETATLAQRGRFLNALGGYIADAANKALPPGHFVVRGASLQARSPLEAATAEVATVFIGQNFSARVPWMVTIVDGELKILDVSFAGSSFLLGQKDKLRRMLRLNGGSLDRLIVDMAR
ncbi:MAG: ABC transporter substrate-binding protein [Alphaproteobacteria bacterium]|nr:ABC transporter substrate-binding protein [Alphaproteobacteria bacterium]